MTKSEAKQRISKLRDEINHQRYLYHVLDQPEISDEARDSLMHELTQLEEQFPELITPDSPTQRVAGEPLKGFQQVTHTVAMLSLNDVFSVDEFQAWEDRLKKTVTEPLEYFVELKYDGLAISLVYEEGLLVRAATRGNGRVGEDVTANVRTIESVPLKLREPVNVEVRGEAIMTKKVFAKVNTEQEKIGGKTYANPRNLAAGTLRQLDPKLVAKRPLEFMAYALLDDSLHTHADEHRRAAELGLKIGQRDRVAKNLQAVIDYYREIGDDRDKLPFNIDGVVVTVNDRATFRRLGVVGKSARGTVAFKFAPEQVTTKVLDIRVNVGRTGAVTPFAVMEPVQVAGTTVSMATLHNEDEIARKDIRIGDTIILQKAGDIIPEVVQSLPNLRTGKEQKFQMPKICPNCGTLLERKEGEAVTRCPNPNCFALEAGRLEHFVSKDAFDIDGIGEKLVRQLLNEHIVRDPADLFHLTAGDLEPLEGFAEKKAERVIEGVEAAKKISLGRFIYALGIRHIGLQTALDLAEQFETIERFLAATPQQLAEVEGIGDVVTTELTRWLADHKNQELVRRLLESGVTFERATRSNELAGLTLVVTGTLETMSREEAQALIRTKGGKVGSSVGPGTDYLVVGASPGSKLAKAEKLDIRVIDEAELKKLAKI